MPRVFWVHAALILANLLYAGNYTIAKEVMPEYIQPSGFIFVRVLVALVVYWVIHALFVREKVERKDLLRLVACGVFGVAINQLLFFKGLDLTTRINAAIMMVTTPILVLTMAAVFIKERMTLLKGAAVVLGLAGALLLFGNQDAIGQAYMGDLWVFLNATSYAIYLVIAKPIMEKYNPLTVIKWAFLFGSFIVIPVGWDQAAMIDWSTFSTNIWIAVAYVVIGVTVLAYFFNIYALKHVNPSIVGIYIYSQPAMATFIAVMANKEELNVVQIIAAVLIFLGVYLVSKKRVKPANN
jgi:drug/metabolite transporter (DMT)-like permease